ncbi:hypothetical protein WMY93_021850 [Mugilogobius chulae]|uniref:B30.2/SPRY domain-containing protein n=1 Tax=Mugilogobius chulae TaxID=88201 RepID=A0AAW0ND16_9GOBI
MPGQNSLLLKWQEHFNSSWASEDSTQAATRNGASALYNKLLHNKEVVTLAPPVQELIGPRLPDFECESCASVEKEEYLSSLLHSQRWLTHRMLTQTSYNSGLQHRLVVLQRIFYALHSKYHDKFRTQLPSQASDNGPQNGQVELASEAFLPPGICKQNWRYAASVHPESMLCNDVLSTASSNKIPTVGLDCLTQIGDFLKKTSVNSGAGGADVTGRRLSLELLLGLAMQRGSLRYLLEWVEVALAAAQSCFACDPQQSVNVGFEVIHQTLLQMRQFSGIRGDCVNTQMLKKDPDGFCHLSQAALCLFEEVCNLASYCLCSCNNDMMQSADTDTVMVYVWGSNSSHQLAEGTLEKILLPKLTQGFSDAQMIEAGQYCTFSVSEDGSVKACGKGSYGRLGLGDSNNQSIPKKLVLEPHRNMKKVSSSKGSDGHTLAITVEGEVFSWGDGEYGKLGHGNSATQKYPKIIQGPLVGKVVICVSAGYRHSAAVTCDGELYTWGEGDFGRLGHSDSQSRNVPTLVKDISSVGQVACGSSHTIAVAQDGRTVWSFGGGDNGKLGHGDTNRVYRPKVIEALQGFIIRKVCAGSQSSLALTSAGQVFAWGCGSCLGCGSSETTSLRPRFIEDLSITKIIDISCGDSHCLALSHENEVYAWGNNTMGQCGQGHTSTPITKPKKVLGLEGVSIQQITAGTSHSLAWTAVPTDRQLVAWHRPFCVDLEESTFVYLRNFLENYCNGIESDTPPAPFLSKGDHHQFLLMCMKLLSVHLSLANAGGTGAIVLGAQSRPLRNLLFRLIDTNMPDEIQQAVLNTLSIGASLLLPPLRERTELLLSLLPQGPHSLNTLSKGQRLQLDMVLSSLQDQSHVASLLGYSSFGEVNALGLPLPPASSAQPFSVSSAGDPYDPLHMAEVLLRTLLLSIGFYTERAFGELEKNSDKQLPTESHGQTDPPSHFHQLLSGLHKHLLAHCYILSSPEDDSSVTLLCEHLYLLLPCAAETLRRSSKLIKQSLMDKKIMEKLHMVLYNSVSGSLLCQIMYSLLLLPLSTVQPLLNQLLALLESLSNFTKVLPDIAQQEEQELNVDCENTDSSMVWLTEEVLLGASETMLTEFNLSEEIRILLELALGSNKGAALSLWQNLEEYAHSREWENGGFAGDSLLQTVCRCSLAVLLKHTGTQDKGYCKNGYDPCEQLMDVYETVYKVRSALLAYKNVPMTSQVLSSIKLNVTVYESFGTSNLPGSVESPGSPVLESDLKQQSDKQQASEQSLSYPAVCHLVVSRCLFLLLGVKAAWVEPSEREHSPTASTVTRNTKADSWLLADGQKYTGETKNTQLCFNNAIGLPLCSLGVMKEAWDRLRQCIGPATSMSHDGSNTSYIVNQVFEFVCGSLVHVSEASSTWYSEQPCAQADPKAITCAILQQQQRAEMRLEALCQMSSFLSKMEERGNSLPSLSALLPSVQLQFLCGCFGLGTHIINFHTGAEYETQHYMRQLQSAAHNFYQQVVCTLRQRVVLEKENPGSCQHLLLASMFALNFCYQPVDLVLVIKCGILEVLSLLTNNSCYLMNQGWFAASASAHALLNGAVKLACARLLQILTVAASSCEESLPIEISIELMEVMCEQLQNILFTFQQLQAIEKGTADRQDLNSCVFGAETIGNKNSKVVESQLADFLVFLRRVLSSRVMGKLTTFEKWVEPLIAIISHKSSSGSSCFHSLRTQLLAFHILEKILPSCPEPDQVQKIVKQLFQLLSVYMWEEPCTERRQAETVDVHTKNTGGFEECIAIGEFSFDPHKLICCTLESGNILSHGSGGKGYGLATTAITSGCFIWKFHITKENRGNEGTCIGVSRWPVRDYNHHTTTDMWLYRAYSGNLYHGGELVRCLPSFTQGDTITCILDMEAHTISFAKNDKDPKLAFEGVSASELYPCVLFYSSNPGEKVSLHDLQMRGVPSNLLPGEPLCSPQTTVLLESTIQLLHKLHQCDLWSSSINQHIHVQLELISPLLKDKEFGENHEKEMPCDDTSERLPHGGFLSEAKLSALCTEVWPVLALIGGVDGGLRAGGVCRHRPSGRRAIVLGILKEGSTLCKLQWEEGDLSVSYMNSWSPSDSPIVSLEPCHTTSCDVTRLGGLKPMVLLDLVYLMSVLEEHGWLGTLPPSPKTFSESETQCCLDEEMEEEDQQFLCDTFPSPTNDGIKKTEEYQDSVSHSQTSRGEAFPLEMRAVKVSYLLMAALKSLNVMFSCEKLSDLLVVKNEASVPNLDQLKTPNKQWDESAELRSVMQYVVQSMVKWAVRPCPIKQRVSLADLERAQIMIYKGALNSLCEDVKDTAHTMSSQPISKSSSSASLYSAGSEGTAVFGQSNRASVSSSNTDLASSLPLSLHSDSLDTFNPFLPISLLQHMVLTRFPTLTGLVSSSPMLHPCFSLANSASCDAFTEQQTSFMEPGPSCTQARSSLERTQTFVTSRLLEMGFSLRHIYWAMEAADLSGDFDSQTIEVLASWMLEHPLTEEQAVQSPHPEGAPDTPSPDGPETVQCPEQPTSQANESLLPGLEWIERENVLDVHLTRNRPPPARRRRLGPTQRTSFRRADMPLISPLPHLYQPQTGSEWAEQVEFHPFATEEESELDYMEDPYHEESYEDLLTSSFFTLERDALQIVETGEEHSHMVKCELCNTLTLQFNNHIKRRTGAYVDVWFKGECGSNFPFYLLCSSCREKYLAANINEANSKRERIKGVTSDLTGQFDGTSDDDWDLSHSDFMSDKLTGLEDFGLLLRPLGLNEKKLVPDPIDFSEPDPLGSLVYNSTDSTKAVAVKNFAQEQKNCLSLGQQAVSLRDSQDRLKALRRVTSTAQILLAYSMVMRALSQAASNVTVGSTSNGLESLGLADIRVLVRLMALAAGGRAHTCVDKQQSVKTMLTERTSPSCLSFLTTAIGSVVSHSPMAYRQLVEICTRELMAAATGVNIGAISDPQQRLCVNTTAMGQCSQQRDFNDQKSSTFLVTQNLVSLLTEKSIHCYSHERLESEANADVKQEGSCSSLPSSPLPHLVRVGPLELSNALAACVLSARLPNKHRQWAAQQLVQALAATGRESLPRPQTYSDLTGDLRKCPLRRLEGHYNKMVSCSWNKDQSFLATCSQDKVVQLWNIKANGVELQNTFSCVASRTDRSSAERPGRCHHHMAPVYWSAEGEFLATPENKLISIMYIRGSHCHVEAQLSRVTALCWARSLSLWTLDQPGSDSRPAANLLVGRLDGSLCWMQVTMQEIKLSVKSTELTHCYRKEAPQCLAWHSEDGPFAAGYPDGKIILSSIDTDEDEQPDVLTVYSEGLLSLKWDPTGQLLLCIINVSEWCPLPGKGPDPRLMMAVGCQNGSVFVWALPQPSLSNELSRNDDCSAKDRAVCMFVLHGHITAVKSLAFCPSGLVLVSGGIGGLLNIWSLQDGSVLQTVTGLGSVVNTVWIPNVGVTACFGRSKDVLLICCTPEWIQQNHVLASCRMALRSQNILGLNRAPCLAVLLERLPLLLQEQYNYEKIHVTSGDQLVHSAFLQTLASVAVGLSLEKHLCHYLLPPHHKSPDHSCPAEWSWLNTYATTVRTAESISSGTAFPETFMFEFEDIIDKETAVALDNNKWTFKMDEQLMSWATTRPEDWQQGGKSEVFLWGNGRYGQLAGTGANLMVPTLAHSLSQTQQVVCGQNCTFLVQSNGTVLAVGEGQYGRLGQGNSDDLYVPTIISAFQGYVVTQLVTSCGSDGHSMALTETGEVFSWGMGILENWATATTKDREDQNRLRLYRERRSFSSPVALGILQ